MNDTIPGFDDQGMLPVGDYEVTFDELRDSVLVQGPLDHRCPDWDASWRKWLVDHLEMLTRQLWNVGVTDVFADGSFVEDKDHPNDIDGYFVCEWEQLRSGDLQRQLNVLDPQKVWTWDPAARRPYPGYPKKQLPMWHEYRVELYPHAPGLLSGIQDEFGNDQTFPAAFRKSRREGRPKGIVKLKP